MDRWEIALCQRLKGIWGGWQVKCWEIALCLVAKGDWGGVAGKVLQVDREKTLPSVTVVYDDDDVEEEIDVTLHSVAYRQHSPKPFTMTVDVKTESESETELKSKPSIIAKPHAVSDSRHIQPQTESQCIVADDKAPQDGSKQQQPKTNANIELLSPPVEELRQADVPSTLPYVTIANMLR